MRNQLELTHQDAQQFQQTILDSIRSLKCRLLVEQEGAFESLKTTISDGFHSMKEANQESSRFLSGSIDGFHRKVADANVRALRQTQRNHRRTSRSLALIDAKLATLKIVENKATGDYTAFAGQNTEDTLLPLMMMKPGLFPFLAELIQTRRTNIKQAEIDYIQTQFLELLAECQEASANEHRKENKAIREATYSPHKGHADLQSEYRGVIPKPIYQVQDVHDMDCLKQVKTRRASPILQSRGSWAKHLPQGILKIQVASTSENEDHDVRLCARFTFLPFGPFDVKGLTMTMSSAFYAFQHPKAFCNIRCFNQIPDESVLYDKITVIMQCDDANKLCQMLLKGELTVWDRIRETSCTLPHVRAHVLLPMVQLRS